MAWGTAGNINTNNLDSGTDSPALARADIKNALDELSAVINGRGSANGVASLDANTLIPNSQIPNELNSSTGNNLVIDPATGKLKLEEILNLKPQTVAQLTGRTDVEIGDVAFCSNGDAGDPCLAVARDVDSAGFVEWKKIQITTTISDS